MRGWLCRPRALSLAVIATLALSAHPVTAGERDDLVTACQPDPVSGDVGMRGTDCSCFADAMIAALEPDMRAAFVSITMKLRENFEEGKAQVDSGELISPADFEKVNSAVESARKACRLETDDAEGSDEAVEAGEAGDDVVVEE